MRASDKTGILALLLCIFLLGNTAGLLFVVNAADFTFTRSLTIGISGNDVTVLQQFLIDGGFLNINAPTGYFGNLTKEGVRKFQEKNLIVPSAGYFGPITRNIVNQRLTPPTQPIIPLLPTVADLQKQIDILSLELQKLQAPVLPSASPAPTTINSGNGLPVRLKIPKISVDAAFQYNSLTADGVMEIPDNIFDAGWYTGSPRPGEKGSSVVSGHVARIQGGIMTKPGIFFDLNKLRPGDTIYVLNDKGESIAFTVREIRLYNPAADATDVFTSSDGIAHLNLITCEGYWNADQVSYSERLVIFTDAVQ